jgi:hypothetical protein
MISDNYEGIIEKRIRRTSYIDSILSRQEGISLWTTHDSKYLPGISKEDSSTSDAIEEVIGERTRRLKEVRDYQPQDIDQSHMQDVLDREPQFPGGI